MLLLSVCVLGAGTQCQGIDCKNLYMEGPWKEMGTRGESGLLHPQSQRPWGPWQKEQGLPQVCRGEGPGSNPNQGINSEGRQRRLHGGGP